MRRPSRPTLTLSLIAGGAALLPLVLAGSAPVADEWTLVGWNDLGMHCMDSDYEVFSVLPPFNTICAQVVDEQGELVDLPAGSTVTYRGVADPSGSINVTSVGKTNFWDHVTELYGASPAPDQGLAGNDMPGPANVPQAMHFDSARNWFTAEGIPITPSDDASQTQNYPMMRLEVRDGQGVLRASTDIVLPVSDEMDCRACHASGAGPQARPAAGWVNESNFERDYRLNLLRLHDENQASNPDFAAALASFGLNSNGLFDTVTVDGRSILCASCHASNALPGTGFGNIAPLTEVMHAGHAAADDPLSDMTLGASENRAACYRCHPGSETRCLRGAMGSAVAADGSLSMQCQSCHGDMDTVGDPNRQGWFEEPACQSCHTGTATHNNGQIRYETVYEPNGSVRQAVDALFATNPDTPAQGLDLYRFSEGHGGLQCSACHGSTHAIYPSVHANDNLQSIALQGHAGTITDCTACHDEAPETVDGGPHGMHPVGAAWLDHHADAAEHGGAAQCQACHGTDYRGTVLSRMQGARTLNTPFGQKHFWEGYQVGCYDCHLGPNDEHQNSNQPPVVVDRVLSTPAGVPASLVLTATDANQDPTALRIVNQPHGGTVSFAGGQATYFPYTGFAGPDSFTYAAADGESESQLGTVNVTVTGNWENFGDGFPGTNGVPDLYLTGVPSLGAQVPVRLGNSSSRPSLTILLASDRSDYQPTPWGGEILVADPTQRVFVMPPQGMNRIYHVPSDASWVGRNVVLQMLIRDDGAAHGFSFSRGLRMVVGN